MAQSRMVNTVFWNDNYIFDLNANEKLVFLYLLTNERTSLAGIYEINLKLTSLYTGLPVEDVEQALIRFDNDKKIVYEKGWVIILNFVKHQRQNPSIQNGIKNAISELPTWIQESIEILEKDGKVTIAIRLERQLGYNLGTTTPQLKLSEAKLSEAKLIKDKLNTLPQKVAEKKPIPIDPISKLYYQAVKSLGLPNQNNNQLRAKINAMKGEASEGDLIDYLIFMRDRYGGLDLKFKPMVNKALDIYGKRLQIINILKLEIKDQESPRVWRATG